MILMLWCCGAKTLKSSAVAGGYSVRLKEEAAYCSNDSFRKLLATVGDCWDQRFYL
jgi:hypothetical protein